MNARLKVLGACTLVALLLFWAEHEPVAERFDPETPSSPLLTVVRSAGSSRVERVAFGRLFTIEAKGVDDDTAAALAAVLGELDELDARLSEWRPGSDIWAVNARAGGDPVEVDADTRELLIRAKELSVATEGLYDPTLGAVRVLWPFGDPSRPLPLRADLERALPWVGAVRLSVGARTVQLPAAGMRLALDGLDVAHAMEAAMTVLEARGVRQATVRAGRDVLARGAGQSPVRSVVVANPRWPGRVVERFTIDSRAAVIIDDMHGALTHNGRVLSSVLDPRTGEPAQGCRSVTVVATDPSIARAHAIAVFVLGPEDGLAWVAHTDEIAALVVDAQGRAHRSAGWAAVTQSVHEALPSLRPVAEVDVDEGTRAHDSRLERLVRPNPRAVRGGELVRVAGHEGVAAFHLDRTEVTNAEYRRFLEDERAEPHAFCHPEEPAGHDHTPRYYRRFSPRLVQAGYAGALAPFDERTFRDPDRPVVGVDFWDAWAFARWAGKRLPTRAELTLACGGPAGHHWPFGDVWDPAAVNSGGERDGERDGYTYAAPADSLSAGASPEGCLNLSGNVAEWTERRWVLGGSSRSNPSGVACGAGRQREAAFRAFDIGFRCAADVGPQ